MSAPLEPVANLVECAKGRRLLNPRIPQSGTDSHGYFKTKYFEMTGRNAPRARILSPDYQTAVLQSLANRSGEKSSQAKEARDSVIHSAINFAVMGVRRIPLR